MAMFGRSLASTLGRLSLLAVAASLGSCGGSGTAPVIDFEIVDPFATVEAGAGNAVQVNAFALRADGDIEDVTADAVWTSDDPLTATVVAGLVTGVAPGQTTVNATFAGFFDSIPVTVFVVPVTTVAAVPVSDVGANPTILESNDTRNLAIDRLGRVHAVWTVPVDPNGGVRYARSIDGGLTFSASVPLVSLAVAPSPRPVIACGGATDVYVAYVDSTGSVLCLHSADAGATWPALGVDTGINSDATKAPSLSAEGLRVHVASIPVAGILSTGDYVRSVDGALTFLPPLLARLSAPVFLDVVADPRNANVVLLGDNPTLRRNVSPDDGAAFGGEVIDTTGLFYSDFAIDSQGLVFGVGNDLTWRVFDVDTLSFSTPASTFTSSPILGRSIAVDLLGVVHVAFEFGGNVILQQSADQGATLSAEGILTAGTAPDCAASSNFLGVGVLYASGGQIFYRHN